MAAASSAGTVAQGIAAASSSITATQTAVIGAVNVVMGTDRDVNIVGVGTAAMGVTVSTAGKDLARREMKGAPIVLVQVLVLEPAPAMATLDVQTAHVTGITKAKGVKACYIRGGMLRKCTLLFHQ